MKKLIFVLLAIGYLLPGMLPAQTCNVPSPVIAENQGVLSTTTTFDSYAWQMNGSAVAGGNQPTLAPSLNGNYTVKVGLRSQNFTLTGREADLNAAEVKLFPNPGNGNFTLSLPADANNLQINVVTPTGTVVSKQQLAAGTTHNLNLDLPSGLYYLQLSGSIRKNIKFVITR